MKKTFLQKALMSGFAMVLLLLFVSTFSFAAESDEINAAIKGKGAKWVAGETSVSKLSSDQRKLRVGLIKPGVTGAEKIVSVEAPLAGIPLDLDWRTNPTNPASSTSCVTGVRDQGNCGSCWAFATAGALESHTLIKAGCPVGDIDLAEQILVSCSRAGSCGGGYIDRASNFIRDTGLPQESCFLYTATNNRCRNACTDWQSNTEAIDSWFYVTDTSPTTAAIKNALNTYGPLATTMDVYTDFFSYESGVYSYVYGSREGGHAVLIVGYSDTPDSENGYFIVKNSWGTGWGDSGFFNIAYSEIDQSQSPVQFGYFTIAYQNCNSSILPTAQSFVAAGGAGTINVTADANCNWNAVSNASWITITAGKGGTGNGSVSYTVLQNIKKTARTGNLTIAGKTFTVTQSGR